MSFKSLVSAISEQRQEIKQALTLFPYFDTWDSNVVAECCELSKIIEFSPDEIILGSNLTNCHSTFFILEGICQVIHHLLVTVKVDSRGKTSYKLYKSEVEPNIKSQSTNSGYVSLLLNGKHDFQALENTNGFQEPENETEYEEIESGGEVYGATENFDVENDEVENDSSDKQIKIKVPSPSFSVSSILIDGSKSHMTEPEVPFPGQKVANAEQDETDEKNSKELYKVFEVHHHLKLLNECKMKSKKVFLASEERTVPEKPKDVKSFFVQVALFYKGACFGLEENMKDSFIVSATKVKCLRIPRRFLLQHNPCNIWNRIRLFFSLYLPQEKQIMEYIKADRNWNDVKKKRLEEVLAAKRIPNHMLCTKLPLSIRIQNVFY